jgi:hypothetical protein
MTTYLRQHGLMSFISLNIPEREINLHFVNSHDKISVEDLLLPGKDIARDLDD